MQDFYSADSYPPARPAWRSWLYRLLLLAAVVGLTCCLVAMGWLCYTM